MKKKYLRLFNKKTPLYAGLRSKQKTFTNCQATYQKELCLVILHRANVQIGLTPLPLFVLIHFLRTPCSPARQTYFLNDPFGQKHPIKVPILTLPSVLVKICQIPHAIFQTTSQFFFKFCIALQFHER